MSDIIHFDNVRRGDRLHLHLHIGDDFEGFVTGLTRHDDALWFAPLDPTDVNVCHPARRVVRSEIDHIHRITDHLSEAQVFFAEANLEEAVLTIMSTASLHDLLDPPEAASLDALVDSVASELRNGGLPYTDNEIKAVTEEAMHKFWKAVAKGFEGIHTGDLPPDMVAAFGHVCQSAVEMWVDINAPR